MSNRFINFFTVFKTAFKAWWEKDPFRQSAVIAYYAIFSLPGLLVVIVTVGGYIFGRDIVNLQITGEISSTMGKDTSKQIEDIISIGTESRKSIWATIIGLFTILLGATGVFVQFQKSLNAIWEVEPDENAGVWSIVKVRLFAFGLLIAGAFILIVSFVVSASISALGAWVTSYFSEIFLVLIQIIIFLVSIGILCVLFALMFKYIPDAKVKWRHVWIGSVVTAILFEVGKTGLGFYFGRAEPGSGYGAAGSIILILLWVSYSSMIVFYGAEFTQAFAAMRDGKVGPEGIAVKADNCIDADNR